MAHVLLSGAYLGGGEPIPVWSDVPNARLVGVNIWPHWDGRHTYEWNGDADDPRIVVITRRGVPLPTGSEIDPPVELTVEAVLEAG